MSIKRNIFGWSCYAVRSAITTLFPRSGSLACSALVENMMPTRRVVTSRGPISFVCPGVMPYFRADTLLTKEPETIRWIDGFAENEVFWDVGANVGAYSLYAALRSDLRVLAFEPSALNYAVLNMNISRNRMDDRIHAYCIAFDNRTSLAQLNMRGLEFGGALNTFGGRMDAVECVGERIEVAFHQGMVGYSIDEFIKDFSPPFPNHIKLDVDGNENKIVSGMTKTLQDERLKSVLVELDDREGECCKELSGKLVRAGLKFQEKERSAMFDDTPYACIYNHIYTRA